MAPHVCPWWGGYFIDNPLRRWVHNPHAILSPYVTTGMTVLDFGCGMGLFAIALAKLVGETGKVIAVDLQQQMLDVLVKRASAPKWPTGSYRTAALPTRCSCSSRAASHWLSTRPTKHRTNSGCCKRLRRS